MTAVEQRGERVYASPMAKRLAEAQQLRLDGRGSGAYGSITSKDLGSLSSGASAPAPTAVPAGQAYVDIPVSNTRTVIAKRLLESKVTIPHYYLTVDVNIDAVSDFDHAFPFETKPINIFFRFQIIKVRSEFNKQLEKEGVKLSFNDFVVKATALASRKVPEANSSWHGSFIRQYVSTFDRLLALNTLK